MTSVTWLDCVKVLLPLHTRIGNFRDVLISQSHTRLMALISQSLLKKITKPNTAKVDSEWQWHQLGHNTHTHTPV